MEDLLSQVSFIIVLVVAAGLWILYHQLFHVVYFGNGFNAMFREFLVCIIGSLLIVGLFGKFFSWLFGAVGALFGFVGTVLSAVIKIALIVLAVIVIIVIISMILKKLGVIKGNPEAPADPEHSDESQEPKD